MDMVGDTSAVYHGAPCGIYLLKNYLVTSCFETLIEEIVNKKHVEETIPVPIFWVHIFFHSQLKYIYCMFSRCLVFIRSQS